jgi:ubiquinone/menaquinone biosynthesis C-methylase UbiE
MTTKQHFDKTYGTDAAQNYEDLFVPRIGRACATALVDAADVRPGERVVDVACGTGIVARLASERTGPDGSVVGTDINASMLAVARSTAPAIEWREAPADALPVADGSFDVALCNLGLMFFPDKVAALSEMRRVLTSGGRAAVLTPGPTPGPMSILADALANNIDPGLAGFVHIIFSLNDSTQIEELFTDAGFSDVRFEIFTPTLRLGPPREFLWDYIHSTPLAGMVLGADEAKRAAFEAEVLDGWQQYTDDGERGAR